MMRKLAKLGLASVLALSSIHAQAVKQDLRIVSAGGSLTEWVVELGALPQLVGVDTTSQHPNSLKNLPSIGYQRQLAAEGILMLNPNLLLGTEEMGPPPVLAQITKAGVEVDKFSTEPSLQALHNNLMRLGLLLDETDKAQQAFLNFSQQIQKVTEQRQQAMQTHAKPRVLMVLAAHNGQSLIAGKETVADWLIEQAGGQNMASHRGFKSLSNEALLVMDPQVVLISDRQGVTNPSQLLAQNLPILQQSSAVKQQRVVALDPTLLVGGLGPRLPKILSQLISDFYPTAQ